MKNKIIILVALMINAGFGFLYAAASGDVVINEVAWMGTEGADSAEWIEFYNNSASVVDISGWSITGAGSVVNFTDATMKFSTIAPGGYLVYADDSSVFKSGAYEAMYKTGLSLLNTGGDKLRLYDAADGGGNLIDEVDDGDGNWFAGDNGLKATMERIDPLVSGALSSNWATNDLRTINGVDEKDNNIMGTPGAQNSVYGAVVFRTAKIVEVKNSPFFPHGDRQGAQKTEAKIYYNVESGSDITIRIYNKRGNLVRTLVNSAETTAATGNVAWTGDDESGDKLGVGVYIVHMKSVSSTGKIKTGQALAVIGRNLK